MNRLENAAFDREEVRREHEITREPAFTGQRLLQLGEMAVRVADGVGAIVLGDLAEQELALGIAAGAGNTRRRIDDYLA